MPETSLIIEPVRLNFAALRLCVNIGADYLTAVLPQSRKAAKMPDLEMSSYSESGRTCQHRSAIGIIRVPPISSGQREFC